MVTNFMREHGSKKMQDVSDQVTEINTERETTSKNRLNYQM